MIKVGILGGRGYVAKELLRLLLNHPEFSIDCIVSESESLGKDIGSIFPEFRGMISKKVSNSIEDLYGCDAVVTSKPHDRSMQEVPELIKHGVRVVDMSAAYRFKDAHVYESWYKAPHSSTDLLKQAVYGLTELYRDKIADARLVANPGCYPVSVILGCAPLVQEGLIDPQDIIVDAYSGVSGAGINPDPMYKYLFCEMDENIVPYSVNNHRHAPEIEQELSLLAQSKSLITFVPHIVALKQGIMSSIYLKLRKPYPSARTLRDLYAKFYSNDFFVRLMDEGEAPCLRNVVGTNFCDIGIFANGFPNVVVISTIDNLIKGAAGQAIQNLNVMFGIEETTSLVGVNAEVQAQLPRFDTIEQFLQLPSK
ncbi:MAG: N-acetyl-gamma-glutamyl-phosphate reductase [Dehalococcoidia bacterium]|nr:N-acetyl-gamma-glutamyl-phosphate reductase [Dehalococcoidia bacterium]